MLTAIEAGESNVQGTRSGSSYELGLGRSIERLVGQCPMVPLPGYATGYCVLSFSSGALDCLIAIAPFILLRMNMMRRQARTLLAPKSFFFFSIDSSILLVLLCLILPSASALSVTTFNILAPVHRSMDASNRRESERDEWWRPRAEFIADYVASELSSSDVVLLQEWWFRPEFQQLFDDRTSGIFHRVAERRPGREDGMAVLINKGGCLEFLESKAILTGPQRIAQLVHCRDACDRSVVLANAHLSFPGQPDARVNERRQTCEVQRVVRALSRSWPNSCSKSRLDVLGGDFNSHSGQLASQTVEIQHEFVNCASAGAEQALSHTGGQVNLGVTHRTHRGEDVSVDHIFARVPRQSSPLLRLGYLDAMGTRVVDCCRGDLELDGCSVLTEVGCSVISDHRPVTATLEWPPVAPLLAVNDFAHACNFPLDPLEPPSYMGTNLTSAFGQTIR